MIDPVDRASGERLAVHPALRLFPSRRQLGGLEIEHVLVGHGEGIHGEAGAPALREALGAQSGRRLGGSGSGSARTCDREVRSRHRRGPVRRRLKWAESRVQTPIQPRRGCRSSGRYDSRVPGERSELGLPGQGVADRLQAPTGPELDGSRAGAIARALGPLAAVQHRSENAEVGRRTLAFLAEHIVGPS